MEEDLQQNADSDDTKKMDDADVEIQHEIEASSKDLPTTPSRDVTSGTGFPVAASRTTSYSMSSLPPIPKNSRKTSTFSLSTPPNITPTERAGKQPRRMSEGGSEVLKERIAAYDQMTITNLKNKAKVDSSRVLSSSLHNSPSSSKSSTNDCATLSTSLHDSRNAEIKNNHEADLKSPSHSKGRYGIGTSGDTSAPMTTMRAALRGRISLHGNSTQSMLPPLAVGNPGKLGKGVLATYEAPSNNDERISKPPLPHPPKKSTLPPLPLPPTTARPAPIDETIDASNHSGSYSLSKRISSPSPRLSKERLAPFDRNLAIELGLVSLDEPDEEVGFLTPRLPKDKIAPYEHDAHGTDTPTATNQMVMMKMRMSLPFDATSTMESPSTSFDAQKLEQERLDAYDMKQNDDDDDGHYLSSPTYHLFTPPGNHQTSASDVRVSPLGYTSLPFHESDSSFHNGGSRHSTIGKMHSSPRRPPRQMRYSSPEISYSYDNSAQERVVVGKVTWPPILKKRVKQQIPVDQLQIVEQKHAVQSRRESYETISRGTLGGTAPLPSSSSTSSGGLRYHQQQPTTMAESRTSVRIRYAGHVSCLIDKICNRLEELGVDFNPDLLRKDNEFMESLMNHDVVNGQKSWNMPSNRPCATSDVSASDYHGDTAKSRSSSHLKKVVLSNYGQQRNQQNDEITPLSPRRKLRTEKWWHDDETVSEDNGVEVGRLNLGKTAPSTIDTNNINVGRLPRHNRPDIWVTPDFEGPISMHKNSRIVRQRSWRVKRVWNFPQFDKHETEHRVKHEDLMDHVKSLLGVSEERANKQNSDPSAYHDEGSEEGEPDHLWVGKLNIKERTSDIKPLPTGSYELKRRGANGGDDSKYQPNPRQQEGSSIGGIESEPRNSEFFNKQTHSDVVEEQLLGSRRTDGPDDYHHHLESSQIQEGDEENSHPDSQKKVGRLNIHEGQPSVPPIPAGDYKWKKRNQQDEAGDMSRPRPARSQISGDTSEDSESVPTRIYADAGKSIGSRVQDESNINEDDSKPANMPQEGCGEEEASHGRRQREVGRLVIKENQPPQYIPYGEFQLKKGRDGNFHGRDETKEVTEGSPEVEPCEGNPANGVSQRLSSSHDDRNTVQEGSPPGSSEDSSKPKVIGKLVIEERQPDIPPLPTADRKWKKGDGVAKEDTPPKPRLSGYQTSIDPGILNRMIETPPTQVAESSESNCDEESLREPRMIGKLDIEEHQPSEQLREQRKVGKLDIKPLQPEKQSRDLPVVGKLEIIEDHSTVGPLPSGQSSWKKQDNHEKTEPADMSRTWPNGNAESYEMGEPFEMGPGTDPTANFMANVDQSTNGQPVHESFKDGHDSRLSDERIVGRLKITEQGPISTPLPTGEYRWKKQSKRGADDENLVSTGLKVDPEVAIDSHPSEGSSEKDWTFELIRDVEGEEVEGPISDLEWADEGEVLVKLQAVMDAEEKRCSPDGRVPGAESDTSEANMTTTPSDSMTVGQEHIDSVEYFGKIEDEGTPEHQEIPSGHLSVVDEGILVKDGVEGNSDAPKTIDSDHMRVKGINDDDLRVESGEEASPNQAGKVDVDECRVGLADGDIRVSGSEDSDLLRDVYRHDPTESGALGKVRMEDLEEALDDQNNPKHGRPSEWDRIPGVEQGKKKLGELENWKGDDLEVTQAEGQGRKSPPSQWDNIPDNDRDKKQLGELGLWEYDDREGDHSEGLDRRGRPSQWDKIPGEPDKRKIRGALADRKYDDRELREGEGSTKQGRPSQWESIPSDDDTKQKHRAKLGDWEYDDGERRYREEEDNSKQGRPSQWETIPDATEDKKKHRAKFGDWEYDDGGRKHSEEEGYSKQGQPSQWDTIPDDQVSTKKHRARLGDWGNEDRERTYTEGEGSVVKKQGRPSEWETYDLEKEVRERKSHATLGDWKNLCDENSTDASEAEIDRKQGRPSQWDSIDDEQEALIKKESSTLGNWKGGYSDGAGDNVLPEIAADGTKLSQQTVSLPSPAGDASGVKKEKVDLGKGSIVDFGLRDNAKPEDAIVTKKVEKVPDLTSPKGQKRAKRRSKARPRLSESWTSPICFDPIKKTAKGKKKEDLHKNVAPLPLSSGDETSQSEKHFTTNSGSDDDGKPPLPPTETKQRPAGKENV